MPLQLFMLASGEVFGRDQPIALQLLGSDRSREALEGVAMELEDRWAGRVAVFRGFTAVAGHVVCSQRWQAGATHLLHGSSCL